MKEKYNTFVFVLGAIMTCIYCITFYFYDRSMFSQIHTDILFILGIVAWAIVMVYASEKLHKDKSDDKQ